MNASPMQRLLIIGSVWPEPRSSAAGHRMLQLIDLFQANGWPITFASPAKKGAHAADLASREINMQKVAMNSITFDEFVADLQPSAVIFDRFVTEEQFGWRVVEQCPKALRILDTEDLHCLRRARRRAVQQGQIFKKENLLNDKTARREIASIYRCDLSLVISEYEMRLLTNVFKVDQYLLHYLPFLLEPLEKEAVEKWPSFGERKHFVSVGNFRHAPNGDAVSYLYHQIWPLIRDTLPEVQMHLYGAYPSQQAWELHDPANGFLIKGWAEDAAAVVRQARVCLAPLRFGAGLKGKLVEAMQCGTPSVTTPVGAEGLAGDLSWSGIIADDPEEIASAALKLYTNQSYWEQAQKRGSCIINQRFSKKEMQSSLIKKISTLQSALEKHRRRNFVGAMLQQHTAASTKYMGRWIEEKNRG